MKNFKKGKRKSKKRKQRNLIVFLFLCLLLLALCFTLFKGKKYQEYIISNDGLTMLNEYELPSYLYSENESGEACITPYDIGDNKKTFGPGITYDTVSAGIIDINKLLGTEYSIVNNCILVKDLLALQKIKLEKYEDHVLQFAYDHNIDLKQHQFDALVFLAYNAPNLFKDANFIAQLKNPQLTKEEFIKVTDAYYQTLGTYYATETHSGFGEGWYRRITDAAELYFNQKYL